MNQQKYRQTSSVGVGSPVASKALNASRRDEASPRVAMNEEAESANIFIVLET